ncbi:hypothetical protein ACFX2H_013658 [Malus domestica]
MSDPKAKPRVVSCIGDTHGFHTKLQNLWSNLQSAIDPSDFSTALIIFLGDYCDRGPDTRKVIDFLSSLPTRYPNQKHFFLSGNHDLAIAAFVGVLPPPPDGSEFSEVWKEYADSEEREGWFKGDGYERMHLQGRRWGGKIKAKFNAAKGAEYKGSIYDAGPTFESYGVPHGSADLVKAIPDKHKRFLSDMVWVHEEDNVCIETADRIKHCRLIVVHAGLEKDKDVKQQLAFLKAKDTRVPKIEALSGRKNVWDIPKEMAFHLLISAILSTETFVVYCPMIFVFLMFKPTIVVSGHHAKLNIEGLKLTIDEGGGMAERPVAAVVLPSMKIVLDTDALTN